MKLSRRGLSRSAGLALVIVSIGALVACVQNTNRDPATSAPAPTATTVPVQPTATTVPSASTPVPTTVPIQVGTTPTQLGLFLELQGLGENTVVRGDAIVASGITSPDAVLSINGVIIPINDDGSFEVTLALTEGPNLLEVVSSDLSGNQESRALWVVALPEDA
ncbi:MAG: hypothetical protein HOC77_11405 [Chloroflexi bacterium]|nr:hypothetical protein [Chloroflexota bacterium]MBT4515683.1 hypothetical protein [Chloroflexota bacterium]MBT5318785.1 hypothetical protein [Chloroflexota bacterium]